MDGNICIEDLEQHLLFQKAMSENTDTYQRISGYMDILNKAETGVKLPDPVDEAIRAVFSLVLENGIDPWEIDLSEFVRLYSKKVSENLFDMIVAGRLMLMAWKILRLQSESTRISSEPPEEILMEEDDSFFYEEESMVVPEVMLNRAFQRDESRPVTMLELIDAFEEARIEIEIQQERERVKESLVKKEPAKFVNKMHEDNDQNDIETIWQTILKMGAGQICIDDLYPGDLMSNLTVFLSLLHLVCEGRIDIWQESLPSGDIFVEITSEGFTGTFDDNDLQAVRTVV